MNTEKLKQERDNWMMIATDKRARMFEYIAFYNYATNNFEYGETTYGATGYKRKKQYYQSSTPFNPDIVYTLSEIFDFWLKDCEMPNPSASAGNGA